jgi:NTE family protein
MKKTKKIAIACQGGGSQTAFTAGVLESFFVNNIHLKTDIVSLSGTSGGAVCAALSWYSLVKWAKGDTTPVEQRLRSFWQENSTQNMIEDFFNNFTIGYVQLVNRGLLPEITTSPNHPFRRAMVATGKTMLPRFYDFEGLLASHIDFSEIKDWRALASPVLLIGAANVKKGEFKKFNSRQNEIQIEAILASAAVPTLFEAVQIGDDYYWDGLFSDNPPIDELLKHDIVGTENIPDEVWIIQINPQEKEEIPEAPEGIIDRRNEMIGNLSLLHDFEKIKMINRFIDFIDEKGSPDLKEKFLARYHLPGKVFYYFVKMSEELLQDLNYASKINRASDHINRLLEDGKKKGEEFLEERGML